MQRHALSNYALIMEEFIEKDGKKLRFGYTTGSCAAAAAKAAAWMLLTGQKKEEISLITPKGVALTLPVLDISMEENRVSCAIRKDSGDDPDVTNGTLVYAEITAKVEPGIAIDGGVGVGRVTKKGLDQSVGSAAINSVPRQMIRENLEEILALTDQNCGLNVVISVPEGERLAKQTFNPRLGIVGGISILGTTGIVEPMSEKALVDTIRVELNQRKVGGDEYVLLTPGNYGCDFIRAGLELNPEQAVQSSNFIGQTLDICRELGFRGALLVGHIGKLVKLGGGMMNTHSKYGDCRMEILAAHAGIAGLAPAQIGEILQCVACDDALRIIMDAGCFEKTMTGLTERILFHLRHRAGEDMEVGTILFSKEYGLLAQSDNAMELIEKITKGK